MSDRFKFRFWNNKKKCWYGRDVPLYKCYHEERLLDYTIEQCTGLKDKNGKLIYEGDILYWDDSVLGAVRYDNFEYVVGEGINARAMCASKIDQLEIIGNIHENAELLEEKK